MINIKTVECDIIMHEMAHAVEKTSGIDLNGDFRKVLGNDMKNRFSNNIQVASAVENVIKKEHERIQKQLDEFRNEFKG